MHVLVAVDEVGQAAEGVKEGAQLRGDLDRQHFRLQAARDRGAQHLRQRQEAAVAQRREAGAHRLERRGQRHMQAERGALFAGIEQFERVRLVAARCGAATMTEVALRRPRAINSRMPALTDGEMP